MSFAFGPTRPGATPPPWSRAERWALAVFALVALASLRFLVHPWYDSTYGDAALYVATARSLVAGDGYTHLGIPFRAHPPGFSLILAPVIAARGTDFHAWNLTVSLFGVAGAVLLAVFLRPRVGTLLALVTALAVWLGPGYQRLCNQVMSDVPGTALLLLCLVTERWASRSGSRPREIALGLCIGLAAHVRWMLILLVPAIAAARVWCRSRPGGGSEAWRSFALRRVALFAAAAVVVVLPWSLYAAAQAPPPPADQTFVYSYSTAMWHRDPADPRSPRFTPAEILGRLPANAVLIARVLGGRAQPGGGPREAVIGGLLVLASLIVLVKRREAPEVYAVGALLLLGLYFDLRDRLLLPIYVLTLAAAVEVLRDAAVRVAGIRRGALLVGASLTALIVLDFAPRRGWDAIERRHAAYASLAAAVAPHLDPEARVGAGIGFHYSVYLERPVYSLYFAARRGNSPAAAEAIIDEYGIDTLLFTPLIGVEMRMLPYFERRYGPSLRVGPAHLLRVRP
jgi:4-amino-4-deoxy-L-arabinose transferase-like glycosyltransferase